MSNPDSFIDEVTEEVRRDRLFALLRRYGWIGVVLVLAVVGGAGWREYSRAQDQAAAQAFGDQVMAALDLADGAARASALEAIEAPGDDAAALLAMLAASEEPEADAAVAQLQSVAERADVTPLYAQIAQYKALTKGAKTLPVDTRRAGFEALAVPGQPLRPLAEEQLALIEIETGAPEAALARLTALSEEAGLSAGLRRRIGQLIHVLGGGTAQG